MPDSHPVHLASLRIEEQTSPRAFWHVSTMISCHVMFDREAGEWVATNAEGFRGTGDRVVDAALECIRNHMHGRTPLPADPAMRVIRRCKLCDTIQEFEVAGVVMVFAPHRDDPEFCRDMTIGRIQFLEKMISQQGLELGRVQSDAAATRGRFADLRRAALDAVSDPDASAAVKRVANIANGGR